LDASYQCNNDHGLSPDGKWLAFSATHGDLKGSQIFLSDSSGANPRPLVVRTPSYFHSWSPDGNWLAFVGQRDANFNLFRVRSNGGKEEQLTSNSPYDDGPDYSRDERWIYFNSNRSGSWKIWRMPADDAVAGDAKPTRLTNDSMEDWFPHPSPDGKLLVFLSFPHSTPGHDVKTQVKLRMIRMPFGANHGKSKSEIAIETLTSFFGGQGTINVNSWSPDSRRFAFVSYEPLH
jgi:Tol biopolymer transport system component